MKIIMEKSLHDFDFWSGAVFTARHLDYDDFNQIESILEYEYIDGITETELNDLFWFEEDTIAQWLGYADFEELMKREEEEEKEEEEEEEEEEEKEGC